jgi:hypothetical protein
MGQYLITSGKYETITLQVDFGTILHPSKTYVVQTYARCSQGGGRQVLEQGERLGDLGLRRSSMATHGYDV